MNEDTLGKDTFEYLLLKEKIEKGIFSIFSSRRRWTKGIFGGLLRSSPCTINRCMGCRLGLTVFESFGEIVL